MRPNVAASLLGFLMFAGLTTFGCKSMGEKCDEGACCEKGEEHEGKSPAFKKSVSKAHTSLSQAIAAAEASTQGKAFDAEMEVEKGDKLIISVALLVGDKIVEAEVDADTGKVLKVENEGEEDEDDPKESR